MMSWFKQPIAHLSTWENRMRLYALAIALVAASVPFLHLYMDDQLTPAEMVMHTVSVAFSTTLAIALFELVLWIYLRKSLGRWSVSVGLFWLILLGVFVLSFIIMSVTHDFLPITLDIWNKHIKHDIVAEPWRILPVILLIGYILFQVIRRYQISQELASLKELNEQFRAMRGGVMLPEEKDQEVQHGAVPHISFPHKGGEVDIDTGLITRVEASENYCNIWVAQHNEQGCHRYMVRITLSDVAKQLPDTLFLRVHRSHIVNFNYVSSLVSQGRNYQLQLTSGDSVPVSRSRIKQIRQRVFA